MSLDTRSEIRAVALDAAARVMQHFVGDERDSGHVATMTLEVADRFYRYIESGQVQN